MPQDPLQFLHCTVDGVEVYYSSRLHELFSSVAVTVEKLIFYRRLAAKGVKV